MTGGGPGGRVFAEAAATDGLTGAESGAGAGAELSHIYLVSLPKCHNVTS